MRNRPDSPCTGICSNLFDDICRGCGRSAREVYEWINMDEEQKEEVWNRIGSRSSEKMPLPPEILADALQDRIHSEPGVSRPAKTIKANHE